MSEDQGNPSHYWIIRKSLLLGVWSVLTAALIIYINPSTGVISLALYVLIAVICLSFHNPLVSSIILLISSGLIIYLHFVQWGLTQDFYLNSSVSVLAFWVVNNLCKSIVSQHQVLNKELQQNLRLIDETAVYDQETKYLRWEFAYERIKIEIARSRRLSIPLSLMLIHIHEQTNHSNHAVENLKVVVADLILKNLKSEVHLPFIREELGVILPETDCENAETIALEMVKDIANVLGVDLMIGIASYPSDADSRDALIEKADLALTFGVEMGQAVVSQQRFYDSPEEELEQSKFAIASLQALYDTFEDQKVQMRLEKCELNAGEWIAWIGGIRDISEIIWVKDTFQNSETIEFLFLWKQFMVVKLAVNGEDTANFARAFSGWTIKDVDPVKRFVLIGLDK